MKKIIGKCKQCGQCCRDIPLDFSLFDENRNKEFIRNFDKSKIYEFVEHFIGCHIMKNPYLNFSKVYEIEFCDEGNRINGHIRGVNCKALIKKGKKYFCSIQGDKPIICKNYPTINSIIREGCGFKKIEVKDKK